MQRFGRNLLRALRGGSRAAPIDTEWASETYGVDPSKFSPREYGDYLALNSAVYVCSRLRAQQISSLKPKLWRNSGTPQKKEVETGLLSSILKKVNPFWTWPRLMEMVELTLCTWGSCYLYIERGGSLLPKELWWVRPDRMRVVPSTKGYISHYIYSPENGSADVPFESSSIVWLRYPNPIDQFSGLSPLASSRISADTHLAALKSNYNMFNNGINLGGLIVPKNKDVTISKAQAREIEEAIDSRFRGVDKAHRWGFLRADVDFKQFNLSPKDAEFLGSLKWTLEDVARAYGVPQDLIGGQRTYENVKAAERALWINTIKPEADFIAAEFTEQLLIHFLGEADLMEFDYSDIDALHEDASELWNRAADQITKGALTINQWLESQGKDPLPWGDVWWQATPMTPVESLEAYKAEKEAAAQMAKDIAAGQGAKEPEEPNGDEGSDASGNDDDTEEEAARLGRPFDLGSLTALRIIRPNGSDS